MQMCMSQAYSHIVLSLFITLCNNFNYNVTYIQAAHGFLQVTLVSFFTIYEGRFYKVHHNMSGVASLKNCQACLFGLT